MRYHRRLLSGMHLPGTGGHFVKPRPPVRGSIPLICVPYCGGTASVFQRFASRLPAYVAPILVQLPGRATRFKESPHRSMSAVIDDLVSGLRSETAEPYALLGYSLGALVCFEFARELRRRSLSLPVRLFALASGAPHTKDPSPPIHELPDDEFISEIAALNGTPREVLAEPELMQALLPMLRADFCVHETYAYAEEPPLDCPISVIGGTYDRRVSVERLEAWRSHTSVGSSIRTIHAGHFFLNEATDIIVDAVSTDLKPAASRAARR